MEEPAMNRFARWTLCAVVTTAFVVAGCDSTDKDKEREKDLEKQARREQKHRERDRLHDPDAVIGHDRSSGDRTTDRARGVDEIPKTAMQVEGGAATGLEYEPARDGVIYVYDIDSDRVIYVGRIRDRERFRLDPDGGRAMINNRTVFRSDINPRHRYRLYFDRAS
jgi:hypothetical protein